MSDDGPGTREVAHRVFAAEFDDASLSYSESDEERAPNYVVTPTGARVNRLFTAGVLTEVERVNDETRRGRVVDPSGAFVTYAGQYQPEAQAFLERAAPPAFIALTGKARTFEPEDSDRVFTSVRPESLTEVDADTRDRWVVSAAEATLDRLAVFREALDSDRRGDDLRVALENGGAPAPLAAGIPKALDHYGTGPAYVEAVRRLAVDALELVAGDRDEVRALDLNPDDGGDAAIGPLPETDVTVAAPSPVAEETTAVDGETAVDEEMVPTGGETAVDEEAAALADATEPPEAETGAVSETVEATETVAATETVDGDPASAAEPASDAATELDDAADPTDDADADDAAEPDNATGPDAEPDVGLGEFDPEATAESAGSESDETDAGTASAAGNEMYQLDDEEREEIESEFGTDFATGTEVDDPGEADIDVPEPDGVVEEPSSGASSGAEPTGDDGETGDDPAAEGVAADDGESSAADGAADADLEAAAVDAMDALDDGDGADREAVVDRVAAEHGADADAVEDAIQDALMSGRCYEPGDGLLKSI